MLLTVLELESGCPLPGPDDCGSPYDWGISSLATNRKAFHRAAGLVATRAGANGSRWTRSGSAVDKVLANRVLPAIALVESVSRAKARKDGSVAALGRAAFFKIIAGGIARLRAGRRRPLSMS